MRISELFERKKRSKKTRGTGGYFFPGYGYYGGGDSGDGGGDGGESRSGMAKGSQQISEYRDRLLQYVKSLLPNYPEYVLKDWLVPNKGDFSNLPDTDLKNGIMEKLKLAGLTPNTKWQLVPNMQFTMDMFEPMTKQRLIGRAGGNSDMGLDVPRDKERHATQAALAQQQGGVRKEPVLLIKTDKGYELLEGWHRTIQHFAKYPDGYTGPAYVAVAQGQQAVTEGATVTRIDSKPITDFGSSLKAYKHTDDWSQSGLDTGDDSYWKNKNLKTNTTKGLFAGDPRRTALYATGNAHETHYVEFTQNGQPIVYFDQKDLPAMRSRKTYLTVFDASNFRQLPTGEWFSQNPGKPIKQVPIGDPFKYIASQGWIVRVTDDLDKVFKQVKNMHKAGKIAQYGAEGMNESQQGVAEAETATQNSRQLAKEFRQLGYSQIGSGADATVWAKDDSHVIKILMPEDVGSRAEQIFRKFYEFSMAHQDLACVPRFNEVNTIDINGKEYTQIEMERLAPIEKGTFMEGVVWLLSDYVAEQTPWSTIESELAMPDTWEIYSPNYADTLARTWQSLLENPAGRKTYAMYRQLYNVMKLLFATGTINKFGWDLHTANVMRRNNGQPVIIDPWFSQGTS